MGGTLTIGNLAWYFFLFIGTEGGPDPKLVGLGLG